MNGGTAFFGGEERETVLNGTRRRGIVFAEEGFGPLPA